MSVKETYKQRKDRLERERLDQERVHKEMISKVRKVRGDITDNGLRSVQLKLEYLESRDTDTFTLESYRSAIKQHLDLQKRKL